MTARVKQEVCARCGHTTPDCGTCGQSWPMLGAGIGEQRYCHTFVDDGPSCYQLEVWATPVADLAGAWVLWPREACGEVA